MSSGVHKQNRSWRRRCKAVGSTFDRCTFSSMSVVGGDWSFAGLAGCDLRHLSLQRIDGNLGNALGLRTRHKNARANKEFKVTEVRNSGEVLQRHALGTATDYDVLAAREVAQGAADDLLARPVRVDVRRVEGRDPRLER